MQIHALLLIATLLAPEPASERPTPSSYDELLAQVEALTEAINAGEPVRDQLFDALANFPRHAPRLATDPAARAVRARAQLNLARTYLSEGADESAAGVMDELLRSSNGEALPVEEFGPSLVKLHEQRRSALEHAGTASMEIRCAVPCRAYVNERAVGRRVDNLYLGIYRVWVEQGTGDSGQAHIEWVQLAEPNQTVVVELPSSPADQAAHDSAPAAAHERERLMPRAAEIALLVVGSTAVTVGGLALGIQAPPTDGRQILGVTMTGVGGAALLLGGISLAVDEVRVGNARGQQALINWRLNF